MHATATGPRRSATRAALQASQSAAPRQRQLALLIALDAVMAGVALSALPASRVARDHALHDVLVLALFAALAVVTVAAVGGYGHHALRVGNKAGHYVRLVFAAGLLSFIVDLTHPDAHQGFWIPAGVFLALPLVWTATRVVARRLTARSADRTIIVGSSHVARHVLALASRHAMGHIDVIGFVDDDPCELPAGAPPVLGTLGDLASLCARHRVQCVVVTFTIAPDAALLEALRECAGLHVQIQVVPRLFDLLGPQSSGLGNLGLVDITRRRPAGVELAAKRILDIVISALALTLLSPLILAIAATIKLSDRGPVLFRQERIGRRGVPFTICKFRSMTADAPRAARHGHKGDIQQAVRSLKADAVQHVTPVGRILRSTSLDELPQLWNVLRGEMSLVGPRPLRAFEVDALEPWQASRQEVLPGLTGLWQVLGRSDVDWDERQQLDFSYSHAWSLGTDLRILAETIPAVVRRRGAH
jgi:exopolysaccharide biosynthesis polyprenyl glycosylphosphotransferase